MTKWCSFGQEPHYGIIRVFWIWIWIASFSDRLCGAALDKCHIASFFDRLCGAALDKCHIASFSDRLCGAALGKCHIASFSDRLCGAALGKCHIASFSDRLCDAALGKCHIASFSKTHYVMQLWASATLPLSLRHTMWCSFGQVPPCLFLWDTFVNCSDH